MWGMLNATLRNILSRFSWIKCNMKEIGDFVSFIFKDIHIYNVCVVIYIKSNIGCDIYIRVSFFFIHDIKIMMY